MNDAVIISLISALSGIAVAYIVNIAAKKVQEDLEDERKARLIDELEEEIRITRQMVKNLEHALTISQQELQRSREDNQELKDMLEQMREEYQLQKMVEEDKKIQ